MAARLPPATRLTPQRLAGHAPGGSNAAMTSWTFLRRTALVTLPWLAAALAGCASAPSADTPVPRSAPDARAAAPADLTAEQQWLQQWFGGTPVVIVADRDATLRIEVPQGFAFDAGQSRVKPPLAAVLDRVAESLRRRPLLVAAVAAPADGDAALQRQRTAAVVRHLRDRGIDAGRLASAAAGGAVVTLRLAVSPG